MGLGLRLGLGLGLGLLLGFVHAGGHRHQRELSPRGHGARGEARRAEVEVRRLARVKGQGQG